MDVKYRMLLLQHQHDIIQDLDVSYILDELYTKNAITHDDFDHIFSLTDRVDRTRYLIETIVQNGNNEVFEAFVDSLSKDYRWLWEKLSGENIELMPADFEDSLSRGDVPRLPDHHVKRIAVQQNVAEKLKALMRHNFLVLHGMSGSGKTSVAISVLRDNADLITSNFNGVVFWINLGNARTEDDIIAQQNKLYRKVSSIYAHNSYMNSSVSMSSIGSNADTHSLSSYDWNWQELRDKLKRQFSEPTLKEALLVLDEVNVKKCVEAFDIGCKILITTRDTDVVSNFHPTIVKIENNFTERETLELFASCLDVKVNQLPRQAKKLHEICKGSPFHIALIGAQLAENKERFNDDRRQWNYYLSRLEKKEFFFLTKNNNDPMKTIEVCIKSLKPNVLPLFKMLTVLPDNAKISAKVLSKLWNKEVNEVESIMKQLRSKSLIIEIYDHDQRNYFYEIHDLIMSCLRTCSSDEEVKKLHGEFLKSYNYDNVNKPPVDIVDDGYIAFYIGYHILNTKNLNNKWQLFNKLFLDLKFLGNKVRLTGPADVILDLQKYENYIADDDFDKELLYNVKSYLSTHGIDLYRYPCTDIVQSILQHEVKGNLYTKALQVATEKCAKNELYFEFLHEQDVEEIKPSNIDVKEIITSVCFLGDYALVGTMTGVIKFFQISTNKLKKELPGSGSAIKWIGACPVNPPIVAALSYDALIKLWYIDDFEQGDAESVIEEEPEEPYNNNYPSNVTIQPKRGHFINCRWANNEEVLIAHTSKLIITYDPTGKVLKVVDCMERDKEILCCIPCNKDRNAIIATSGTTQSLEVIDLVTKERIMAYEETDILMDILTVPGTNKIITLKQKEVMVLDFKHSSGLTHWNVCECKRVISSDDVKEDLTFLSVAVNKSGTLLFVSTDDSRVICVDLKTNFRVFDLDNRRGNVISMAVSEVFDDFMPGSDVLLTGTGTIENTAKVWYLDAAYVSHTTRNGKTRLTTKFDVSFVHTLTPQTPINSATNSAAQSTSNTPKRHQSFVNHREVEKKVATKTMSLDRHSLKPLVLKGIRHENGEESSQPLLAVVDDKNNIQIMRGRKVLTEIPAKVDEQITTVKISPCNQYILYGLKNGNVIKYTLRSKESKAIMDVYSPVQYLNFVNANLLMVAGKNRCLMAYRLTDDGVWKPEMMQPGNTHLGSQEILNDIQGKRKINPSDRLSDSGSDISVGSKDRMFPNGDSRSLSKSSGVVDCFWVQGVGLITVESNATIKLWGPDLKLISVLNGRQTDIRINSTAFQKDRLVICDDSKRFQTFELRIGDAIELHLIQEYKLNNRIISCDLTADGVVLAMGLDSGDVVLWNVRGKRQLHLLKHHKTKVQYCSFSPVPDRLVRSNGLNTSLNSPSSQNAHPPSYAEGDDEQPPLVLVTMASEIVWWNVTYLIKMRANKTLWRIGFNVVTPVVSPISDVGRSELTPHMSNMSIDSPHNFFFGDVCNAQECWKANWKRKTYKEGSKRKEILACIKLSGMNAKKLCHDDKFSCFVTVDNPGYIHIMNVMKTHT
ncbi:uncharacterized protein LOC126371179 [Pectinophora gossypiella]|uniref:uncharacterized protein LOC126371179 n=1 Tax=Pectinophora gossypiella TaxID=13191 RepID=UPI00214EBC3A|nr:uncharacterized protein LOC126371179 [Pectinophora gossypiella]XP_049872372.1 uncharacterized protein LOC126371179 [Pectinophora gossypiella]XP_049872373.1 uncharacterized protein LOC126371179 [Pectinophora gossypiella]XP_049872374.1 uncharacterized protein LOC126371179 [Pectinophora gossypiella]XP_049872375.1 uncharacterized protein LOC126371179 [Pectinophora gossypiella]XP_049872376.1 uncharacterized protein LOC126371179 [Pectinophora gossypiella]XP_049872377.1 uncharacterized protein LO